MLAEAMIRLTANQKKMMLLSLLSFLALLIPDTHAAARTSGGWRGDSDASTRSADLRPRGDGAKVRERENRGPRAAVLRWWRGGREPRSIRS